MGFDYWLRFIAVFSSPVTSMATDGGGHLICNVDWFIGGALDWNNDRRVGSETVDKCWNRGRHTDPFYLVVPKIPYLGIDSTQKDHYF